MEDDDQPNVWISGIKIGVAIAAIIGAVWFALWYAGQNPRSSPAMEQAIEVVREKTDSTPAKDSGGWGIVRDSPIRRK
jgi:hypothetical protein